MNLVHIITRLTLGGSARNTIDSAAAAVRMGYRTILATGPSGDEVDITSTADSTGCELVLIPSFRRRVSPVHDTMALLQTIRLIQRHRADIVHTHTSKAGFIGRLAANVCRVPIIIHTPHGHIFHGYYGKGRTRFFVTLERAAAKLTDRIVVLTDRGAKQHLERGIGRPEQFASIPSGVDIEALRAKTPNRNSARQQLGWKNNDFYLLGVGRLVPIKGFDLAVTAMKHVCQEVPGAHLVLLGDGPERAALEALARREQLMDRLCITGVEEEPAPYLAAADVLVAPSRNEGMGRVIVEAMSVGLPVVASRVGGIPSVVEDGRSGRLVPPENPQELSAALVALLRNASLRREYGDGGRLRAEMFSLPVMESKLQELYREVATEKGIATPFQ
jgi:glycosyltransferase involved in cell wall biosynthesis